MYSRSEEIVPCRFLICLKTFIERRWQSKCLFIFTLEVLLPSLDIRPLFELFVSLDQVLAESGWEVFFVQAF